MVGTTNTPIDTLEILDKDFKKPDKPVTTTELDKVLARMSTDNVQTGEDKERRRRRVNKLP